MSDLEQLRFFFSSRRRHTRFDCDWSSDVCSSDLDASATSSKRQPESVESAYAIPAAPAALAAASSPCGYMSRLLPTGARINGVDRDLPSTDTRRSHAGVATAQRGRNVTSSNA